MIRYSTPTLEFETDILLSQADNVWLTFKQDDTTLRKEKSELEIDGYIIRITLTQEETAMFKADRSVRVQLRWLIGEKASGSNIIGTTFKEVLENEVITSV